MKDKGESSRIKVEKREENLDFWIIDHAFNS